MKTLNSTILLMFLAIAMAFTACTSNATSNVQDDTNPLDGIVSEQEALDFIRLQLKCHTANVVNLSQGLFVNASNLSERQLANLCDKEISCNINDTKYVPNPKEPNTFIKFNNSKLDYVVSNCDASTTNFDPTFTYTYNTNDVIMSETVEGSGNGVETMTGSVMCDDVNNPQNIIIKNDNVFSRVGNDKFPVLGNVSTDFKFNVTEDVYVLADNKPGQVTSGTITKGAATYEIGVTNAAGIKTSTVGTVKFLGNKKATVTLMAKEYSIDWNDLVSPTLVVSNN